ncbi:TetR/AcrR family transcriptional regulator [Pseudoprimorskyibacter insulae]|uniref:HTH-type transcriptional repressor KstR n=1 Tax=Pseudoprimorskyibacter insulae TaxID=1695997 RepID=A0A2R8ATP7_9RHOB|nr:TetR/AcrR family transcriptional regulator [Pseudoprimorskyibacter insulae]SPF79416.1 HTH-type transcriptional repressor KstR [Pseudoprimorskyibacter insulae]
MTEILLRKQPLQARSKASFEAILEAAAQILVGAGFAAFNTNTIAERAGVSVGTLYQYFPGKEAILAELVARMRQQMLADLAEANRQSEGQTLAEVAHLFINASLRHHQRNPALAEALEQAECGLALEDGSCEIKFQINDLIIAQLERFEVPDPQIAARDLSVMVQAMADAATQAGETDFDALAKRCGRAVKGYLRIAP